MADMIRATFFGTGPAAITSAARASRGGRLEDGRDRQGAGISQAAGLIHVAIITIGMVLREVFRVLAVLADPSVR